MRTVKPFENVDNKYTRVHNYVLDVLMPREQKSTLCVLLVAIRCTVGWQKDADRISLSQFEKRTGLARNTVIRALRNCLSQGYLLRFSDDAGNYLYTLNQDFETAAVEEGGAIIAPLDAEVARLSRQPSATIAPEVARLSRPQKKKERTKKSKNTTNKERAAAAKTALPLGGGGVKLSPQAKLFLDFGISLNPKTIPLLDESVEAIQGWIDYVNGQGDIKNKQGRVVTGLCSGYQPPRHGSEDAADPAVSEHRAKRTVQL